MDVDLDSRRAAHEDVALPAVTGRDWTTFRVRESGGITVVELLDMALVGAVDIQQFSEGLEALIAAGHDRIVLNFGTVLHLSSQVLGTILKAQRRCVAAGGQLKLCEIQLPVAEIFALTGMGRRVEIYAAERHAIESDWPRAPRGRPARPTAPVPPADGKGTAPRANGAAGHHPLPSADAGRTPPSPDHGRNGSGSRDHPPTPPTEAAEPPTVLDFPALAPPPVPDRRCRCAGDHAPLVTPESATTPDFSEPIPLDEPAPRTGADPIPLEPKGAAACVRLIVLVGRAQGRAVEMPEARLIIGRDPCCRIRALSPLVSRIHAIIERRHSRVFIRDISSTNGTFVNDRKLHGEEVEVHDGDRLGIGPLRFAFAIGPAREETRDTRHETRDTRHETRDTPIVPEPPAPAPEPSRGTRHEAPDTSFLVPPPIFVAANPTREASVRPSPTALAFPGGNAAGRISIEQLLLQLLRASGQAEPIPGPKGGQAPPSSLPSNGAIHDGPRIEAGGEYPLGASSVTPPQPVSNGVSSPRPRATRRPDPIPPKRADAVDESLERAVLEALETLDRPEPEPPVTRPETPAAGADDPPAEEPDVRPHPSWAGLESFPFSCPGCGAEGRARLDQLGHQLSCNRCGARFYLNASGGLVVGDRARMETGGGTWSAVSYERRESNVLERLAEGWARLSGPVAIGLGIAAVVGVIGLTLWLTTGPSLPTTLEGRAEYVADAFARESRGRLQAVAAPETSRDAGSWLNLVRPHFFKGRIRDLRITVKVLQQDGKKATVQAHLVVPGGSGTSPPGPPPAPASVPKAAPKSPGGPAVLDEEPKLSADGREIDLKMFWVRNPHGEWRLDGTRTFESAVRSRFWRDSAIEAEPVVSDFDEA